MDIYVFSINFADMKNYHRKPSASSTPLAARLIATVCGAGYCPKAPGTAGAFVGLVVWIGIAYVVPITAINWLTLALIMLFTALGIWSTATLMPTWGNDPSRVVIDEVVGVWTALLAAPAFELENRIWMALAAFVLFRLFDIYKPLGIRSLDRHVGAFWVMADDILAGVYVLVVLLLVGNIPHLYI